MWKSKRRLRVVIVMMAMTLESLWAESASAQTTQPGSAALVAPSSAPATQPAKSTRARKYDLGESRPPIIWAQHISDEHFRLLCGDLGLGDEGIAAASGLHQQYIANLQALAEVQDEARYQWNVKIEDELAPLIEVPDGTSPRDLPNEEFQKWSEQQRMQQMGVNRAYGHPQFALRSNDLTFALSMEAMKLERDQRVTFLQALQESLSPASAKRWDRAMRMLVINLNFVFETSPRAMISDPSRVGLHQVLRNAAGDGQELRGLVNLPGLETESSTAAAIETVERLDRILIDYEITMAALLDEDPIRMKEMRHEAIQALNHGEFEASKALEAHVRERSRAKYDLKTGTALAIAEFLRHARGDAAATAWTMRFNAALFPALHFDDSVDGMHAWLTSGEIALNDEQRTAIDGIYHEYVAARQRLRERIMPLMIDVSCDPNAMVGMVGGELSTAQSALERAREERAPLAENANKSMRAVLDSEAQLKFDTQREALRRKMQNSLAQPSPP